jgi:hypothetical protein
MSNVLSGEQVMRYPGYDKSRIEANKAAMDAAVGTAGAWACGAAGQQVGSSLEPVMNFW